MDLLFPQRIARLSYLVRNIALGVIATMLAPLFERAESGRDLAVAFPCAALFILYWGAFVIAPRCRDTGLSPWLGLLVVVPVLNLFIGGYLTWKRSWPTAEGIPTSFESSPANRPIESPDVVAGDRHRGSDALSRLEALRDEGVLTEQDFLRRKARLGREQDD